MVAGRDGVHAVDSTCCHSVCLLTSSVCMDIPSYIAVGNAPPVVDGVHGWIGMHGVGDGDEQLVHGVGDGDELLVQTECWWTARGAYVVCSAT